MTKRPNRHRHTAVAFAFLTTGKVDTPFLHSLLAMREYDQYHHDYLNPHEGGGKIAFQSSPRIAEGRSRVIDLFMQHKDQGGLYHQADWLLWLDADAVFDPDLLEQLMAVADEKDTPIVGALAFGGGSPERMFPTLYTLSQADDGRLIRDIVWDYPRNALCTVHATGSHAILIHRSVFHVMFKLYEWMDQDHTIRNPYPWYAEGHVDHRGDPIGEDIMFCHKANACGFPVKVHTGVKTGHVKAIVLDEALWDYRVDRYGLPGQAPPEPSKLILPGHPGLVVPA